MNRRNALMSLTVAAGGTILPATLFSSCQSESYQPKFFTNSDIDLINEIGETILPKTTDAPGAKELKVANFIDVYVNDCYSLKNQEVLQKGLVQLEKDCHKKTGKSFSKMTNEHQNQQLVAIDLEAKNSESTHYFSLLKSLVLFAYFTSKEGAEKALHYLPIPGKYEGDYPLKKGDKAWALG